MPCLEKSLADMTAEEIVAALRVAIPARDVAITAIADPHGALVEACCVEVYLMLDAQHGVFSVRCWHAHGGDPYKAVTASSLEEAVGLVSVEFAGWSREDEQE